jgi:Cupin domain
VTYVVARDEGVISVWWPYQPQVGRYTTKLATEQTDGRLLQLLCSDRRGGAPPLHIHRDEDEPFFVISGEISFFVGGERIEATAEDFVLAPRGIDALLPGQVRRRGVPDQRRAGRGGAILRRGRATGHPG